MNPEQSQSISLLRPSLDGLLRDTVQLLRDRWEEIGTGFVACTLIDRGNRTSAAVRRQDDKTWLHAERQALELFTRLYGPPSREAWMISTLSPCLQDTRWRDGSACSDLLRAAGIRKVYTGRINADELRVPDEYALRGLDIHVTADPALARTCDRLVELFREPKLGSRLEEIKRTARAWVFEEL